MNSPISIRPLAAVLLSAAALLGCSAGAGSETARPDPEPIAFAPCSDGPAAGIQGALCGRHRVWEDRLAQSGRQLDLDVVVLRAIGPEPRSDPIFLVAGGPGEAATLLSRRYSDSWMRRDRDLVLVDQRGTNGDHRLACQEPVERDLQSYLGPLFEKEPFRACRARLEQRAELTKYGTPTAMDDLDEVRAALGYERINLIGGSYGSRASTPPISRASPTWWWTPTATSS